MGEFWKKALPLAGPLLVLFFLPMLLRAFAARRKALLVSLLLLSLAVGVLEGLFVLIAKSAVTGAQWRTWSIPLLVLALVVTLRSLGQIAAARLELGGVFAWLAERRALLLAAAAGRAFPAYRDPWRNTLVTSLDGGMDDLAQGLGAGFRCLAALAHAAALAPVLFLFSWKLAAAALCLAAPAWLASRLRARVLATAADGWTGSRGDLARDLDAFAEGLESETGNARLGAAAERMADGLDRHAGLGRRWETAKAVFPPALEWFFFMALAALALFAGGAGSTGAAGAAESPVAGGPATLLPFGALLLLLYRPIREWARNHPMYALGNRAWLSLGNLQATLESFPIRGPRPVSASGLVAAEGLRFGYGGPETPAAAEVFHGLDLELDPVELTWITGRNGAGKSTLLKLLADIEAPQAGRLSIPAGLGFAYLPQRAYLGPDYGEWLRDYRRDRAGEWQRLAAILALDALIAKAGADGKWAGLSGGERQRLCLARVFASEAEFLLLDEPTTWLTASDRERVLGDLLAFWRRPRADGRIRGGALVSHEPFLGEFCARAVRLEPAMAGAAA